MFIVGHLGTECRGKVFPVSGTDGENPCKLQEITSGVSDSFRIYNSSGLARTLKSEGGGLGAKMGLYTVDNPVIIDAIYNSRPIRITDYAPTLRADRQGLCVAEQKNLNLAIDLTANNPKITENVRCLKARYTAGVTNFSGDNSGVLVAPVLTPDREEKRQNGRRIKEAGEPMFTLTAQDRHGIAILNDNIRIRKLTPKECWRLQGFPDEYFDKAKAAGISDTQLYKQAGNSVSVPVAKAIGVELRRIELCQGDTNNLKITD